MWQPNDFDDADENAACGTDDTTVHRVGACAGSFAMVASRARAMRSRISPRGKTILDSPEAPQPSSLLYFARNIITIFSGVTGCDVNQTPVASCMALTTEDRVLTIDPSEPSFAPYIRPDRR
jgi:hypothetical protein